MGIEKKIPVALGIATGLGLAGLIGSTASCDSQESDKTIAETKRTQYQQIGHHATKPLQNSNDRSEYIPPEYSQDPIELKGEPISVVYHGASEIASSRMAVVLNVNGKRVLCESGSLYIQSSSVMRATALVQAEISDGDHEMIAFKGAFNDRQIFRIHEYTDSRYTITLNK